MMNRPPSSPLAPQDYNRGAAELPQVTAPSWMSWVLWFVLICLFASMAVSLFGPMDEYVSAPGEVRPLDYTLVFSSANGVLQKMLVEDGDEVTEGQVVARIWVLPEQVALDPTGIRPFEITSPSAGTVLSTARIFEGERVLLGAPLVKLVRGQEQTIRLYASEDRIDQIKPGQLIRFRVRSNPDRLAPFATARVTHVARDRDLATEDKTDLPPASYYIKATIETAPYEIPFGAQLDAEIVLRERPFWQILLLRPHRGENQLR